MLETMTNISFLKQELEISETWHKNKESNNKNTLKIICFYSEISPNI